MPITFTGSYGQNFDALASSGSNNAWSNDQTLPPPLPGKMTPL